MRSIKRILPAQKVNMGGILLDQPLPWNEIERIDPFLLVHHWKSTMPGGQRQNDTGVGPHPHRGFSPVTFIFKGALLHQDSRGNKSVVSAGGTQWMNSGMGVIHSERLSREMAENGGDFEIIQFWVNTPSAHKMDQPDYQPLSAEDTPGFESEDGKVRAGVVCGTAFGLKGPIRTQSDLIAVRLDFRKGGRIEAEIPGNYNAFIYLLDGSIELGGRKASGLDLVWLENDGDKVSAEALEDGRAILLAGVPLNEKVASYGPFVMNDQTQIMQALRDYQMGKMGVLIEDFS